MSPDLVDEVISAGRRSDTASRRFWEASCEAEKAAGLASFAFANLADAKRNVQLAELAFAGAQAVAMTRREEAEALRPGLNTPPSSPASA